MTEHVETPVKVNAWVDKGVAPLVAALNDFDRVWTAASCEGGSLAPYRAYVMFSYQGTGTEAALFAAELVEDLGDSIPYCVETDWRAGNREPLLTISCPPDRIDDLALAVKRVAEPVHGTGGTGLRS